ncbi:LysR family transcriptional regulator [Slackia heliotrinireducens]|uniref:LysR family transcriptional regulator n=1 Tax=Slackia heliotrinireducens TaxID=84110 RepID=UPI0033156886
MMRIEEIESFVAVAEELNFSRAAERLFIAQPALTRQIASLEKSLGVKLFDRTTRNVRLTEEGQVFLRGARRVLEALSVAEGEIKAMASRKESILEVGYVYKVLSLPTPEWVDRFVAAKPGVVARSSQEDFARLNNSLLSMAIDVGFYGVTDMSFIPQDLEYLNFAEGHEDIVLPTDHRLAGRPFITVEDLAGETFAFPFTEPTKEFSPAMREIAEQGISVSFYQTGFEESALSLVEKGEAITGLSYAHGAINRNVVVVPFRSVYSIKGCMVWNPDNNKKVLYEFIHFVEQITGLKRN